ncbi:hypothetical protein C1924_10320 [Stenotrophomonas sp. ESTM1D_MKCIP4_1]|uniref:hypothetical protein n=1 Tax=Stenotrophomonas sp. ESTM1D_MKCIP4_1 TaxID=2072414 RepID=UPI000D53FDD8|nr:hypothetical protein [Stenotrophomonas sp. ESTM1D_MKCIP4_1]AWH53547.1 hypothetical protein C1924_10320 [Stenotrophomonas sp. ESTM1D_MKCIP4_1]
MKRTPATATAADTPLPPDLFDALRRLLLHHRDGLSVVHDTPEHVYANCRTPAANGKPHFFGAVKVSGRKHAFHFMPVYDFPELLADISPALKKRMQGKSCFNFERFDAEFLAQLKTLVDAGAARYKAEGRL